MTACGTDVSEVRFRCPGLTRYADEYQKRVYGEKVEAEKQNAAWPKMIDDYGRLRNECGSMNQGK